MEKANGKGFEKGQTICRPAATASPNVTLFRRFLSPFFLRGYRRSRALVVAVGRVDKDVLGKGSGPSVFKAFPEHVRLKQVTTGSAHGLAVGPIVCEARRGRGVRRVQRGDRDAPTLPQVGAVSLGADRSEFGGPSCRLGAPALWPWARARAGRFGRSGRWTMTEGAVGVCGLSRACCAHRSCVRGAGYER